jgi:hypothetical protein
LEPIQKLFWHGWRFLLGIFILTRDKIGQQDDDDDSDDDDDDDDDEKRAIS